MEAKDTVDKYLGEIGWVLSKDSTLYSWLVQLVKISFKVGRESLLGEKAVTEALGQERQKGRQEVVELALQAIKDELEFPSDMPDELWAELNGNRQNTILSMRNSVRLTKKGIIKRLKAQLREWNIQVK